MNSYIEYICCGDVCVDDMSGCDIDEVLISASKMYAFEDCTDIIVLKVVHEGKQYLYEGWQPGMTYTFRDEAGNVVWSNSFPEWDH